MKTFKNRLSTFYSSSSVISCSALRPRSFEWARKSAAPRSAWTGRTPCRSSSGSWGASCCHSPTGFSASRRVIFGWGSHRISSGRLRPGTSCRTTWRGQSGFRRTWTVSWADQSTFGDTRQSTYRTQWPRCCRWFCPHRCTGQPWRPQTQTSLLTPTQMPTIHQIPNYLCIFHPVSIWKMIFSLHFGFGSVRFPISQ